MDLFYGDDYQRRQDALFAVSCTLTAIAGEHNMIRLCPDQYLPSGTAETTTAILTQSPARSYKPPRSFSDALADGF